jgi:hypothetical protein
VRIGIQNSFCLGTLLYALVLMLCAVSTTYSQIEIGFSPPNPDTSIEISANHAATWKQGIYDVWHLKENVFINQGSFTARADQAIIWHESGTDRQPHRLLVYLDGNTAVDVDRQLSTPNENRDEFSGPTWNGRLICNAGVQLNVIPGQPFPDSEMMASQGREAFFPSRAQQVQYQEDVQWQNSAGNNEIAPGPILISPNTGETQMVAPPSMLDPTTTYQVPRSQGPINNQPTPPTNVEITPKHTGVSLNLRFFPSPVPGERIGVATGGVRIAVQGPQIAELPEFGNQSTDRAVITADNVVVWQSSLEQYGQGDVTRWELYLEGNVMFAMGDRVVFADRMYYDANFSRGTILSAEVLTPIPSYKGLVRLKADVVRQVNENYYQAHGASITSSRIGVPRYWLQSNQVDIRRQPTNPRLNSNYALASNQQTAFDQRFDPFNQTADQASDPYLQVDRGQLPFTTDYINTAESTGNAVYLLGVPVFYWPRFKTNLDNPSYYLERVRIGNDNVFGTQVFTGFDMYQILGIDNPTPGTQWILDLDYLSERGFAFGTEYTYQYDSFLGFPGIANGQYRSWFINDSGLDNLGRGRTAVPLEEELRGQTLLRHHHQFNRNTNLRAELGYLSDRNFLEQYFEREWDTGKDYTTGAILTNNYRNQSVTLNADFQINDFFTQTEWLPRADHFISGQPLLFGRAVLHGHTHLGYGRFQPLDAPTNPVDLLKFDPLAWEVTQAEGVRTGTRQEIDFPVSLGPVKVVPYVLGDATYWQEDITQNDLFRAYGQTGIRASLPMWNVDPTVQSCLYNLNGLAHKVTFDTEFLYADASQDLDELPLYDQLDDDSQEAFRRRFAFDTFNIMPGGNVPLAFDERYFAHRYGMQSRVSSPANEIADDLMVMRSGIRNRWQTKRGLPGEQRIIDWMTFDVEAAYFPKADRDNFGQDFGMLDYDYSWHIGDRLSLVSDGYFDFFNEGLKTASVGVHASRPAVGNIYLGVRSIEGPISSNVLSASVTYQMSDKWIVQAGSSVDFGETGTIGQQLGFIHVGESFLLRAGLHADASRGNVGFLFGIEPRFLNKPTLARVGGVIIPPSGVRYFE